MLPRVVRILASIIGRSRVEAELAEELRDHLERDTAARRAQGLLEPEARAAALRAFGGVERVRDEVRDARGITAFEDTVRDVRHTVRRLRRSRLYAALVIGTVALGMGATAVIVAAVDGVLLKPLPYAEPARLMTLWQTKPSVGIAQEDVAVATFLDWQERARSFAGVEAANPWSVNLRTDDVTQVLEAWTVTERFFDVVGTAPLLGRTFRQEDFDALDGQVAPQAGISETATQRPAGVVVLAHGFWQRHFGGDPTVVGRSLELDGAPHVVIGVMPRGFQLPEQTDLWLPNSWSPEQRRDRFGTYIKVFGRLAPGATAASAQRELDAIASRLEEEWPRSNAGVGVRIVPLDDHLFGAHRGLFSVLAGAVGLLMLVTMVNVAALHTVRLARQRRDVAIQSALGARRRDVVRPVVVEALMLVGAGAFGGLLLAVWGTRSLRAIAPAGLPRVDDIAVDLRTAVVIAVLAMTAAVGVALLGVRRGLPLREIGGRTTTSGRSVLRVRRSAVVVQLALGLVLLVGTSLLVHSFVRVLAEPRGYETGHILSFTSWVYDEYPDRDARTVFVGRVVERLSAIPGVIAVGVGSSLPLADAITGERADIVAKGHVAPIGEEPQARATVVSPAYFDVLGVRLVRGRLFDARDTTAGRPALIVNESFVRRFLAGAADPVGEQVAVGLMGRATPRHIVGVVGDTRHAGLDVPPEPAVYLPFAQYPLGALTFVIRTSVDPASLTRVVGRTMGEIDERVGVARVATMEALLGATLRARQFLLTLLAVFAGVAILIATVGVYGVMSQSVAEREREIGVRVALGATPTGVVRQFAREAAWMTAAGLALGLAASAVATRALSGFLYQVAPLDPGSVGLAAAAATAAAVVAALVPSWRATRVNPVRVLQE